MSTNDTPRTVKVTDQSGRPVWVGDGAVDQGGSVKLYRCTTCNDEVVWAKSSRTGRHYLVNVSVGYRGQRFYMKHNVHRCEDRLSAVAEQVAADEHAADIRSWTDRIADAQRQFKAGEITQDELLAIVADAPA